MTEFEKDNFNYCKNIANDLEAIADGHMILNILWTQKRNLRPYVLPLLLGAKCLRRY